MKNRKPTPTGTWATTARHQTHLSRGSILGAITGCLISAGLSTPAMAADALPNQQTGLQTNSAPVETRAPKGYSKGEYQEFASRAGLPTIRVAPATLEVGDAVRIPINPSGQLTTEQQAALTNLLQVPVGVITRCLASSTNQPPGESQQLAEQLRVAVIDYKFLTAEWIKYHPQGEGLRVKAQALQSLEAGEIAQVWDLYDRLPRPAAPPAPSNLHTVVAQ